MNLTVIGGDLRQVYAAELLTLAGHTVKAISSAAPPLGVEIGEDAEEAARSADAILLPIPAADRGGVIRGTEGLSPSALLPWLRSGSLILGGNLSASLVASARELGIRTFDYLNSESFVLQNAYLTAQAALGILLRELPVCLHRTGIAVLGFGRIGKFLVRMLRSLGAEVTVFARSGGDLAMASLIGVETKTVSQLSSERALGAVRAVVNTAPARLLTTAHLSHLEADTLLLELASGSDNLPPLPNGSSLRVLSAQGLPGKCFPKSAGRIVAEATQTALSAV